MRAGSIARVGLLRGALACAVAVTLFLDGCVVFQPSNAESPPPPRIVVSLTFTDGHADQYDRAAPLLAAHGMPATFYVVSRWTDERRACCLTWWQIDDLYRAGHEIGGMGLDHEDLTAPSAGPWRDEQERRRSQVCADRKLLADRGYDPRTFAYPGGAFATRFPDGSTPQDLVRSCGYIAARVLGGIGPARGIDGERLAPADPFAVRTPEVGGAGPIRLQELTGAVTAANRTGGWVPLAFDRVCRPGTADYGDCTASPRSVDEGTFAAFLDWLAASGQQGGAPAGTVVRRVRDVMGAPEEPVLPPRPTIVSLTFDDANTSQYLVRPVLLDYGIRATFFVNSALPDRGRGAAMSWAQLRGLAADGNEIGGHTLDHVDVTKLTRADKEREICLDRDRLIAEGFHPVSFAYPGGAFDAESEDVVRSCGYRSARAGGNVTPSGPTFAETIPPSDPYATSALGGVSGPLELAYLQSAVESAASHGGGWVQIVLHVVCRAPTPDFDQCMATQAPVELGVLTEFIDWLTTRAPAGTEVRTVDEVMRRE